MPNVLIIGHYAKDAQESMGRYGRMLETGFLQANWSVKTLVPPVRFGKLSIKSSGLGKWLGYLDKFVLFPIQIKRQIRSLQKDGSPYLICLPDHSHGIYLHWLKREPHVVHCHDLLAIRSALGEIPENRTGWTGRIYQKLILSGLRKGRNFISGSHATDRDLRTLIGTNLESGETRRFHVAWNGLNYPFHPIKTEALS